VYPIVCELLPGRSLALCDLVLVMRKLQIHAASVNVESFAEVLHRHRGALDMPARAAASEWGVPARFLAGFDQFPKSEIACVLFIVFVRIHPLAAAGDIAGEIDLRELAVIRKGSDAVIDRAVGFIRFAVLDQLRDDLDHLLNMVRRSRRDLGPLHAQCVEIFPKGNDIRGGKFVDRDARAPSLR
jgi:hypothetical protein